MIASHGYGYNLIVPEWSRRRSPGPSRSSSATPGRQEVLAARKAGDLYMIDMRRFEGLQPSEFNGVARFTPATVTLLTRNPRTKRLVPVAIAVSGYQGSVREVYSPRNATNGAWVYALQAAKVGVTVFGIWLGHVYQWHIVTASMLMTMFENMSPRTRSTGCSSRSRTTYPVRRPAVAGLGRAARHPADLDRHRRCSCSGSCDVYAGGRESSTTIQRARSQRLGIDEAATSPSTSRGTSSRSPAPT